MALPRPTQILTAPETRSSLARAHPPRRDPAVAAAGAFYPLREGAGYAGGITSAALDGILTAEAVIEAQKG